MKIGKKETLSRQTTITRFVIIFCLFYLTKTFVNNKIYLYIYYLFLTHKDCIFVHLMTLNLILYVEQA